MRPERCEFISGNRRLGSGDEVQKRAFPNVWEPNEANISDGAHLKDVSFLLPHRSLATCVLFVAPSGQVKISQTPSSTSSEGEPLAFRIQRCDPLPPLGLGGSPPAASQGLLSITMEALNPLIRSLHVSLLPPHYCPKGDVDDEVLRSLPGFLSVTGSGSDKQNFPMDLIVEQGFWAFSPK